MKIAATALGLAILVGSAARAEESVDELRAAIAAAGKAEVGNPAYIVNPIWTRRPNADDLWDTYPVHERGYGIPGRVGIICRIGDKGELKLCVVDREDPPGKGFGEAGVKLSRRFRMKAMDDHGAPVAGRLIYVPIDYRLR